MIKSKIDARERALELAVKYYGAESRFGASNIVGFANVFEQYLAGNAKLPETQSDTELVKAFLDVLNNELEKTRRQDNIDFAKMLEEVRAKGAGIKDSANENRCKP